MAKLTHVSETWRCDVCACKRTIVVWPDGEPARFDYANRQSAIADGWRPYAVLRHYRSDRIEPPFIWRFVCPAHAATPDDELRLIIANGPAPERWEVASYAIVEGPRGGIVAACVSGSPTAR